MTATLVEVAKSQQRLRPVEPPEQPEPVEDFGPVSPEHLADVVGRLTLRQVASAVAHGFITNAHAETLGIEAGSPLAAAVTHACHEIARAARQQAAAIVGRTLGRFPF